MSPVLFGHRQGSTGILRRAGRGDLCIRGERGQADSLYRYCETPGDCLHSLHSCGAPRSSSTCPLSEPQGSASGELAVGGEIRFSYPLPTRGCQGTVHGAVRCSRDRRRPRSSRRFLKAFRPRWLDLPFVKTARQQTHLRSFGQRLASSSINEIVKDRVKAAGIDRRATAHSGMSKADDPAWLRARPRSGNSFTTLGKTRSSSP